jgi:hypothetical protein
MFEAIYPWVALGVMIISFIVLVVSGFVEKESQSELTGELDVAEACFGYLFSFLFIVILSFCWPMVFIAIPVACLYGLGILIRRSIDKEKEE